MTLSTIRLNLSEYYPLDENYFKGAFKLSVNDKVYQ